MGKVFAFDFSLREVFAAKGDFKAADGFAWNVGVEGGVRENRFIGFEAFEIAGVGPTGASDS